MLPAFWSMSGFFLWLAAVGNDVLVREWFALSI